MAVLLVLFLAGGFTLDRISPGLPALDLRWVGLAAAAIPVALFSGSRRRQERSTDVDVHVARTLFLAWAAWLSISAVWSPDQARVADNVTSLVVMAAAALLVWFVITYTRGLPLVLERLWTWFYGVAALYLVAALAAGPGIQGRYSAFGGGPNVFVRVMVFGLVASVVLAWYGRRLALCLAPGFVLGAVLSGSRGGLLAALVVAAALALPLVRLLPRRIVIRSTLAVLAAAATAVVALPSVRDFLVERFVDQTAEQQNDAGRGSIYHDVFEIAVQHPLTGAGLDSYYALVGRFVDFEHPHNLVLATTADGGLIGLVLLVLAVGSLTAAALRHRPLELPVLMLLATGWFVLLASMFSGSYYDSRFAWFFLGLAAVCAQRQEHHHGVVTTAQGPSIRWWAQSDAGRRPPRQWT
ncbi:hypothetical protein ASD11_11320 [Aeromicrobium sp. Root495]|uniref:O-antigen ligase family protein n=1 Tax=Aeromicrobium sp. Root495 TaxID=1736550 RepID=UPI0006F5236E|nr:O-antigen ligase family protein [Aeromicrobium sp. Root495]KQY60078.1 hypothetical protein ASD11_11320 [Aeromicrobium sp. Root495]